MLIQGKSWRLIPSNVQSVSTGPASTLLVVVNRATVFDGPNIMRFSEVSG